MHSAILLLIVISIIAVITRRRRQSHKLDLPQVHVLTHPIPYHQVDEYKNSSLAVGEEYIPGYADFSS